MSLFLSDEVQLVAFKPLLGAPLTHVISRAHALGME